MNTKQLGRDIAQVPIWVIRGAVLCVCALISLFLLASGYESLYNRSLPFVHTLDGITLQSIDKTYDLPKATQASKNSTDVNVYGKFGAPVSLKLPGRTKKLDIVPAISAKKDQWLARANTLHFLAPEKARNGNIGVMLLYCRASFRTLDAANMPAEGSNLFIDTDHDWRYVYKITSRATIKDDQAYIPADNGSNAKLVIICDETGEQTSMIIEANLLSVQGIEK